MGTTRWQLLLAQHREIHDNFPNLLGYLVATPFITFGVFLGCAFGSKLLLTQSWLLLLPILAVCGICYAVLHLRLALESLLLISFYGWMAARVADNLPPVLTLILCCSCILGGVLVKTVGRLLGGNEPMRIPPPGLVFTCPMYWVSEVNQLFSLPVIWVKRRRLRRAGA